MAWITKYRDDRWRAQIRRQGLPSVSKTFRTKADAEKWARDIETKMDKGVHLDHGVAKTTTVKQLLERFRDEVCPTRGGAKWEATRINKWLNNEAWVDKKLATFTSADVQTWRDKMRQTLSDASVHREMNLLSGIITYAKKEWRIPLPTHPVRDTSRPPRPRARKRVYSPDETTALLNKLGYQEGVPPKQAGQYAAYCLLLAMETAMRVGEICGALVEHCNLEKRWVYLPKTKNNDERYVPLSSRALELLGLMIKEDQPQLVPFALGTIQYRFRSARNALALPDLHFHDSRRQATTALSKKVDVLELARITGHRDLKQLLTYYQPDPSEIAAKLG